MPRFTVLTAAEQVAAHLRDEILSGAWSGLMPGGDRLAADLGIGRDTVEAALQQLEKERILVNQGRRRGRRIAEEVVAKAATRIQVVLLLDEKTARRLNHVIEVEHELKEVGHKVSYAPRTMIELGMDVKRIAPMVEKCEADAWIVIAGSLGILEWFAAREMPSFAMFGRRQGLPMAGAGPDKTPAMVTATRALTGLGHRRIVLLTRPRWRLPEPGVTERAFLEELAANGISPGPYNLPNWAESIDGFHACLDSLYRLTPPTALIVDEAPLFAAARHFLARRGLNVPEDVSLICTDADPTFAWCKPPISHIRWESGPVVKRILQWAGNVSRGKKDLRQTSTPAEFVPGGSLGRVMCAPRS